MYHCFNNAKGLLCSYAVNTHHQLVFKNMTNASTIVGFITLSFTVSQYSKKLDLPETHLYCND